MQVLCQKRSRVNWAGGWWDVQQNKRWFWASWIYSRKRICVSEGETKYFFNSDISSITTNLRPSNLCKVFCWVVWQLRYSNRFVRFPALTKLTFLQQDERETSAQSHIYCMVKSEKLFFIHTIPHRFLSRNNILLIARDVYMCGSDSMTLWLLSFSSSSQVNNEIDNFRMKDPNATLNPSLHKHWPHYHQSSCPVSGTTRHETYRSRSSTASVGPWTTETLLQT